MRVLPALSRRRRIIIVGIGLALAGAIGAVVATRRAPAASVKQPLPSPKSQHARAEPPPAEPEPAPTDALIRIGDFRAALARCDRATEPLMALRAAICHEALGHFAEAAEFYHRVANARERTRIVAAALAGLARCQFRMTQPAVRDTVARVLDQCRDTDAIAESLCLQAWLERTPVEVHFSTDAPSVIEFSPLISVEAGLDRWLVEDPAAEQPAMEPNERKGWSAVLKSGRPDLVGVADVALGNVDFAAGRTHAAASGYERAVAVLPAEQRAFAAYNLGAARFRAGQMPQTRAAFLLAIDSGADKHLAGLAYWWVGRAHLDAGEPREALTPFRKAVATSPDVEIRALAAIGLATAHLGAGVPTAAHDVLQISRVDVRRSSYRAFAAVLDLGVCGASPREMLEGLVDVPLESPVGPAGVLILGAEFERAGLSAHAAELYRHALPGCRGVWAVRLSMRLAEIHYVADDWESARRLYEALSVADPRETGPLPHRRLAEIALRQDRPADCIAACRKALRHSATPKVEVLKLMGTAYERSGDRPRAASCYAGVEPEE